MTETQIGLWLMFAAVVSMGAIFGFQYAKSGSFQMNVPAPNLANPVHVVIVLVYVLGMLKLHAVKIAFLSPLWDSTYLIVTVFIGLVATLTVSAVFYGFITALIKAVTRPGR